MLDVLYPKLQVLSEAIGACNSGVTWRQLVYPNYKVYYSSFGEWERKFLNVTAVKILKDAGCQMLKAKGYDASDVIASIANLEIYTNTTIYIVTGDFDLGQLIKDKTYLVTATKKSYTSVVKRNIGIRNGYEKIGFEEFRNQIKVLPERIPLFRAINGDETKNIVGIRDLGQAASIRICAKYESVCEMYMNIKRLPTRERELLLVARDSEFPPEMFEEITKLKTKLNLISIVDSIDINEFG